ncbi:MAG TPA: hypothetical protein VGS21_01725 [Acidimicrobiales bacterium]|nr:hypothetical protein [Acidimicrobiales bacterium]
MFGLTEKVDSLGEVVAGLRPEAMTVAEARAALCEFARAEKLAAAGRTLLAGRVLSGYSSIETGVRTPGEWLALQAGISLPEAISCLDAAQALDKLPGLEEAVRGGELSADQVSAVAKAAVVDPASETDLIEAARRLPLDKLRDKSKAVKAAATAETDKRDVEMRVRDGRYHRYTQIPGGMRGEWQLPSLEAARFIAALDAEEQEIFAEHRRDGRTDTPANRRADALVALGERPAGEGKENSEILFLVDLAAFRRGETAPGETCEIAGVGPCSLATVQLVLGEARTKTVVSDGVDPISITHHDRYIPAPLRTALKKRDRHCVVPGCSQVLGLEIDHWQVDYHDDGPTELANLARICRHHHYLKTHRGYRLTGGPGRWGFVGPTDGEEEPFPDEDVGRRPPPAASYEAVGLFEKAS